MTCPHVLMPSRSKPFPFSDTIAVTKLTPMSALSLLHYTLNPALPVVFTVMISDSLPCFWNRGGYKNIQPARCLGRGETFPNGLSEQAGCLLSCGCVQATLCFFTPTKSCSHLLVLQSVWEVEISSLSSFEVVTTGRRVCL